MKQLYENNINRVWVQTSKEINVTEGQHRCKFFGGGIGGCIKRASPFVLE